MSNDNGTHPLYAPPVGHISGPIETPPASDPNFRWNGPRTDGDKSPQAAVRARAGQFRTVEEFAQWRRSKNFPELSQADLEAAFARFRGEAPGEKAICNTMFEHR